MSTAVAERLDSLVTKDPPPCEVMLLGTVQCGRPSTYKIHRACDCGAKSVRHVCQSCYFELMMGTVSCHYCLTPITKWTLA